MGDGDILENAEQIEVWFWDGDFGHVLGCVEGEEDQWLVEKGVLHTENDDESGVRELIEGDTVYRIRRSRALGMEDPREELFTWWTVSTETGVALPRAY